MIFFELTLMRKFDNGSSSVDSDPLFCLNSSPWSDSSLCSEYSKASDSSLLDNISILPPFLPFIHATSSTGPESSESSEGNFGPGFLAAFGREEPVEGSTGPLL